MPSSQTESMRHHFVTPTLNAIWRLLKKQNIQWEGVQGKSPHAYPIVTVLRLELDGFAPLFFLTLCIWKFLWAGSINFFCCFFTAQGADSIQEHRNLLFHFYKTCLVSFKSPMSFLWCSAVFIYLKSPNWQHLLWHITHHGKLQAGVVADCVSMYLWIS